MEKTGYVPIALVPLRRAALARPPQPLRRNAANIRVPPARARPQRFAHPLRPRNLLEERHF